MNSNVQFYLDILSAREILTFYARLKGVIKSEEHSHVKDTLVSVGLSEVADRQSKELSGGMRRRLSLGISLVGDPDVIFLDEPTTYEFLFLMFVIYHVTKMFKNRCSGLDPETKRGIWNVLFEIKVLYL